MKLKRIMKALNRRHGKYASVTINTDYSGCVENLIGEVATWRPVFRFDNLAELRAHLGIQRKNKCAERIIK